MPEIPKEPYEDLLEGFADSLWTLEQLRDQALAEINDDNIEFGHAQSGSKPGPFGMILILMV